MANLVYLMIYREGNGLARNSHLKLGQRKIKTPLLFFGQLVNGIPNPWEFFDVDGILLNSYHILQKPNVYNQMKDSKNLNSFLKINHKTSIMLDSGGFLFQKRNEMNVNCREILNLYHNLNPDLGVVLDHPFSPELSIHENQIKRWTKTIKNTDIMLNECNGNVIIPVIHGYTDNQIKGNWKEVNKILEETNIANKKKLVIGIGSLVPLIMTSNGAKKGKEKIVDLILRLRSLVPNAHIHVFGIGGATTAMIMFYLGIDSLDSVGWRLKAAKGAIQLPGVSDRFVNPPSNRTKLSESDEDILDECDCPICKNHDLEKKKGNFDTKISRNFINRAIHNAWVYQEEIKECRKAIKNCIFEEFIEKRLKKSGLKNMFEYAKKVVGESVD